LTTLKECHTVTRMKYLLFVTFCAAFTLALSASAQKRPAITGIAFARVYASNPASTDAFYKMLGLPAEAKAGSLERYDVNASQWVEVVPLPSPAPDSRFAAVGFTTRDVAGMEKYIRAHHVTIFEPLKQQQFAVLDPEGNRVYFVQQGSHKLVTGRGEGIGEATSQRIIHVGLAVKSADVEDTFYKTLLGFQPYWYGGQTPEKTSWVSLQVPEGSDWLEYMLQEVPSSDPKERLRQLGVLDHFSLGVEKMTPVPGELARNGCGATPQADNCAKTQMGKDGKVQLNVFDPDQTRVEYMEFKVSGPVCCSEIHGRIPTDIEDQ
jgi:catechol 2,3-dioxygenase-like lactoylglutathione lyase family enzyme